MTPDTPADSVSCPHCPHCDGPMRSDLAQTAVWVKERLFVVEDIPAQVCDSCVEQFYDEETTDALRRLTEQGFPLAEAKREIVVPVFSLAGRLPKPTLSPEDEAS
jgi:YgiT-type zinc finger domain-containing protein